MYEIIINPAGAGGRTLKAWHQAEKVFCANTEPYRVHYSTIEHDINAIADECTRDERDIKLIIIGGDGSMNRAINGIRSFEHTRLGFIPAGSGDDLAKALHISADPVSCAKTIVHGKAERLLDIGQVTYHNAYHALKNQTEKEFTRLFNISCGIGFDAHICQQADGSKWKKKLNKLHLGKLIYGGIALDVITHTKPVKTDVLLDERPYHFNGLLFCAAMNEPYEGGGFAFCPKADGADGILDFCAGDSLSTLDVLRIFPYALFGRHDRFKGVYINRFHQADIHTAEPEWVHQDGEVECMSDHITIQLHKHQLHMLN